jgi:hypothetical protein
MVIKLIGIIPPAANVKLDEAKKKLEAEVYDKKLSAELPKMFAELHKAANPTILLKGPPSQWQFKTSSKQLIEDAMPRR